MSVFAIVLLFAAVVLLVAAEWGRVSRRFGTHARAERRRARRKANLRVVRSTTEETDSEEFARAVERDLAALPTIDEHDARRGNAT